MTRFPFNFHANAILFTKTVDRKRYWTRNLGHSLHRKGSSSIGPACFQLESETAFCNHYGWAVKVLETATRAGAFQLQIRAATAWS